MARPLNRMEETKVKTSEEIAADAMLKESEKRL